MICPNCNNEVKENDKFCEKCGFHLAEMAAPNAKKGSTAPVCKKCRAELKPGAKFCIKCGSPVGTSGFIQKTHASNSKPILLVLVILVLFTAAGIAGFFIRKGMIPIPRVGNDSDNIEAMDDESFSERSVEEDSGAITETVMETIAADPSADVLFSDIDELVETMKIHINEDAETVNVMNGLSSAVNDYVAKAEEAGSVSLAAGRIEDAYRLYVEAVNKHKDMMSASTLSGAIYAQVMSELDAADALGNELVRKGYGIDLSEVETSRDVFDQSYRERIIDTFDEFTTRDAWSRTEAWKLMKDTADNMFDSSDLDDPIRQRYAYALAWWTQKQTETELASGIITEKGAAIKIAGLLEAMDYNPMMINCYIRYMEASGEDCSSVVMAYNEVVQHIKDTQGIEIGKDMELAKFWYFNDISEPADGIRDGATNGVTKENREWIRNRMNHTEFVTR